MQCISVDLPEPDGPMIAVNLARVKTTLTSVRARTVASSLPKTRDRWIASATRSSSLPVIVAGGVAGRVAVV